MSDTTTRYGIVEPSADRHDAADVPYYIRQAVSAIERSVMYGQGLFADRPVSTGGSPGIQGRVYAATDTGVVYYDYGTGWLNMSLIAHAATHALGGSDPLKLDDLAAPDDNTDLNVSTTKHGLQAKLTNEAGKFASATGGYATATVIGTSIAALGSAYDGKTGMLRLGSSPYTFVRLTYDATYGKWVSDERQVTDLILNAVAQDGSQYSLTAGGLPYSIYTGIGLRWQFKYSGRMYNTYGSTFTNMDLEIAAGNGTEILDMQGGSGVAGGGFISMAGFAANVWQAIDTDYHQYGGNTGLAALIAVPVMFTQNVGGAAYWQGSLIARLAG